MLFNCGVGEDSWESLGLQDPTSPSWRRSVLGVHWKDWCWSWNSNTSATWCEELTHWKRPWCWERLKAGGEGDDRGWDGWMASPIWWTWVEQDLGVGDGQRSLACCSPWDCKECNTTERMNWTEGSWSFWNDSIPVGEKLKKRLVGVNGDRRMGDCWQRVRGSSLDSKS